MTALPWYRHRWPWILMSGPAAVLVAGAWTTWIAFASSDGLVAEDYYKQGLAINKVLAREQEAARLGLAAELSLSPGKIQVQLKGAEPQALFVHLAHGTRAGFDQRLRLARTASGTYESTLGDLPAGRWRVAIEDPQGRWRIAKEAR